MSTRPTGASTSVLTLPVSRSIRTYWVALHRLSSATKYLLPEVSRSDELRLSAHGWYSPQWGGISGTGAITINDRSSGESFKTGAKSFSGSLFHVNDTGNSRPLRSTCSALGSVQSDSS